jgi:pimeloyl-ACP methyl ester carboxylesterase
MAPILLVHGAWHGPWCWDDFAERLAERGHDVRVAQLRGHDHRPGRIWHRVHHYVEDVEQAAAQFAEPPIVVGHSLGGLVVQKYLEHNRVPGAVLMASIPHRGTLAAVARLGARHPLVLLKVNLLWSLRPFIGTPALVRELFFTPSTAQEVVEDCRARLQDESYPAFIDTIWRLPRSPRIHVPVLVLAAELDGFFTVAEMRRTARAYRTEAEVFPAMGHDMMLDQGWQNVADRVHEFASRISASR